METACTISPIDNTKIKSICIKYFGPSPVSQSQNYAKDVAII